MILYSATKSSFCEDVQANRIDTKVHAVFQRKFRRKVGQSELRSWSNSLLHMNNVLMDDGIPQDARVAIEYRVPQTSKRIDFILTGRNCDDQDTAVIVELKQWSEVKPTGQDAVVETFLGGAQRYTPHPSYQAWSYAALLEDYNQTVRDENIRLVPCTYLHNCVSDKAIRDPRYSQHLDKAPAFLKSDTDKLRRFLRKHVVRGDSADIMYRIEHGKIKPSKNLADTLVSLLEGNQEFLMIDDQKVVYEEALRLVELAAGGRKQVLIVDGGPGTGKSVVAVNLLVALTQREKVAQYVTKNAAPRAVYESKLTGTYKKTHIGNLFKNSGAYIDADPNSFDALIVDEAHRLNAKSGMFSNLGENQIKELIEAARFSVFFIDEDQRVTWKDIGDKAEIRKWAIKGGAQVTELGLTSQFRCNGSDAYLAWVDNALQIRETAHPTLEGIDFDVRVLDSPSELRDLVIEKNIENNKSRMVAGYCWDWASKKDSSTDDIEFPEHGFAAQWNLVDDGSLWITKPGTERQVGCIHTCQGLELDYVGVIIGPDFVVRDGLVVTDAAARSKQDASVKGYKKGLKTDPVESRGRADSIIKNTYRTLLSRGQKGCYLYCTDAETNAYFKDLSFREDEAFVIDEVSLSRLPLEIVPEELLEPYLNAIPVYDLRVAAGEFGDDQDPTVMAWVRPPEDFVGGKGRFIARVFGESMNRRIPNGAWCLFKTDPGGSRQGKVTLVQHRDIQDPDHGGRYTVKIYRSEKRIRQDGSWSHTRILLSPDSRDPKYRDIVLEPDKVSDLKIIGELVAVLV